MSFSLKKKRRSHYESRHSVILKPSIIGYYLSDATIESIEDAPESSPQWKLSTILKGKWATEYVAPQTVTFLTLDMAKQRYLDFTTLKDVEWVEQ